MVIHVDHGALRSMLYTPRTVAGEPWLGRSLPVWYGGLVTWMTRPLEKDMRTGILAALVLLSACADGLVCGSGTSELDGECVGQDTSVIEAGDPTLLDLLDALPDCITASVDGTLDVAAGCVGDGCIGDTVADLDVAFDETGDCRSSTLSEAIFCDWSNGVSASFEDLDGDQVADPDSTAAYLSVRDPNRAATVDGLGVGATVRCFVDVWGSPDSVAFGENADGTFNLTDLKYYDLGVFVGDGLAGFAAPDGVADSLFLFGAD